MVYGYSRIPVVEWLQEQAEEGLVHAHKAGELVTLLGGYPSLSIGPLLDKHLHDLGDILRESLANEKEALVAYYQLASSPEGNSVLPEIMRQPHCPGNSRRRGEQDASPDGTTGVYEPPHNPKSSAA